AAINSAVCLAVSVTLSIAGVRYLGLWGAAIGGVITLALGELWAMKIIARTLAMPMHRLLAWTILWPAMLGTGAALLGAAWLNLHLNWHGFPMLLAKGFAYLVV